MPVLALAIALWGANIQPHFYSNRLNSLRAKPQGATLADDKPVVPLHDVRGYEPFRSSPNGLLHLKGKFYISSDISGDGPIKWPGGVLPSVYYVDKWHEYGLDPLNANWVKLVGSSNSFTHESGDSPRCVTFDVTYPDMNAKDDPGMVAVSLSGVPKANDDRDKDGNVVATVQGNFELSFAIGDAPVSLTDGRKMDNVIPIEIHFPWVATHKRKPVIDKLSFFTPDHWDLRNLKASASVSDIHDLSDFAGHTWRPLDSPTLVNDRHAKFTVRSGDQYVIVYASSWTLEDKKMSYECDGVLRKIK